MKPNIPNVPPADKNDETGGANRRTGRAAQPVFR
jgi:hypothetical protein